MSSFNKIILMGNLTRDPELSYLPSQTACVEFSIATNRKYLGRDGQEREEVMYIDCRMYGKRAEVIREYFQKGKPILIEGRLVLDRWIALDGNKRSRHRIYVESFSFVGSSNNSQRNDQQQQDDNVYDVSDVPPSPPSEDDNDNIPF